MWWPPNRSIDGAVNQMIFCVLSALSVFNYVMATICGPGFLPFKWEAKVSDSNQFFRIDFNIFIHCRIRKPKKCCNSVVCVKDSKHLDRIIVENVNDV